jgi:uncharacterized membrane protein YccC
MISLSTRAKEAIKTGLAMVLVYGIAMQLGWENPFWAALTVATASVLSTGQSLGRATMRALGTAVGAVAPLAIIALFPQERWWLFACLSLFLSFCTYMMTGKSYQYFWFLVAFTSMLIMVTAAPITSQNAFTAAVMRTSETMLGALVYGLVAVFIWPLLGAGGLNDSARKLVANQAKLYRSYRDWMSGSGAAEGSPPLRTAEVQLLAQVAQALSLAEVDSPEVREVRHQWRRFYQQLTALREALDLWPQAFRDIQPLNLPKLLPNLEGLYSELDLRFEQIEQMLANQTPSHIPQIITLAADKTEMQALTRLQKAAVGVTLARLKNIERLTRSMFECLADIRGYTGQDTEPDPETTRRSGPTFDPDRFKPIIIVVATLWVGICLWIYVNPPGGQGLVLLAVVNALVYVLLVTKAPYISALDWFQWWGFGTVLAGLLYFLVMPHLSSFAELAVLIFAANFAIYYLFGKPQQLLARMLGMASFAVCLIIDNQQTYNFSSYVTFVFMIMGGVAIAAGTKHMLQISTRPEKDYLRLRRRFFQRGEAVMARLGPDWERGKQHWLLSGYLNDLLGLPQKLTMTAKFIDYRTFPQNKPEEVQALTTNIEVIALKISMLEEARRSFQVEQLGRQLQENFRSWRTALEALFQRWAENPIAEPADDLQERLTKIETRIAQTFATASEGQVSDEAYETFYRLLASYRSLTEVVVVHARLAERVDFGPWREARF